MADAPLAPERLAEAHLAHRILVSMAIAIPICILFFVGLLDVAMSFAGDSVLVPSAMGAGIGVLAGAFFGVWAGFVGSVAELDRSDLGHHHAPPVQ
jgi:hypothetical protein